MQDVDDAEHYRYIWQRSCRTMSNLGICVSVSLNHAQLCQWSRHDFKPVLRKVSKKDVFWIYMPSSTLAKRMFAWIRLIIGRLFIFTKLVAQLWRLPIVEKLLTGEHFIVSNQRNNLVSVGQDDSRPNQNFKLQDSDSWWTCFVLPHNPQVDRYQLQKHYINLHDWLITDHWSTFELIFWARNFYIIFGLRTKLYMLGYSLIMHVFVVL